MIGEDNHSVCLHKSTALGVARTLCEENLCGRVLIYERDGTVHLDNGDNVDDGGPDIGRILVLLQQLKRPPVFELHNDNPGDPQCGMTMRAFALSPEDFPDLYGGKVTPIRRKPSKRV